MAQQINDNFSLLAGIPLDDRNAKTTIGLRDAIPAILRFEGLLCYVSQTSTLYQLQGGIENSNWIGIAGSNVTSDFETEIEGFLALSAGKTTLNAWEVGDKFRGWIGTRYVVGSIVSLPVSLPSDIDNPAKVSLEVDSNETSGFELLSNKATDFSIVNNTLYPSVQAVKNYSQSNLTKINVEQFGVIGDGVTDNTMALNSLFANSASNGTEIVFPKGNYLISDSITVNYPCVISGLGDSKITQTSADKTAFYVAAEKVSFSNLEIDNNSLVVTDGVGIVFDYARECELQNVFVSHFYKNVEILNGGGWRIEGCSFIDPVLYGLQIQNIAIPDEGDAFISNCAFYGGKYANSTSIFQESGGGLKIINCKFNASTIDYPLYHVDLNIKEATSILLVQNNSFEGFKVSGVRARVVSGSAFDHIVVNNNQFSSYTAEQKIFVDLDGAGATMRSVQVQDNNMFSATANLLGLIRVNACDGVAVSGNLINTNVPNTITNCTDINFKAEGRAYFNYVNIDYNDASGNYFPGLNIKNSANSTVSLSAANFINSADNLISFGQYSPSVNGGRSFVSSSATAIDFNPGYNNAMRLNLDTTVDMVSLAGSGDRIVSADSDGKLKISTAPTAPTAAVGTNTTQIATMAALQTAITNNGVITTATNITNATLTDTSLPQNGKTLYISNGATNINYTVNAGITASFVKGGNGTITFVQGSGRTMVAANGTLVFNGAQYSTASVVSFGTTDIVYINNF